MNKSKNTKKNIILTLISAIIISLAFTLEKVSMLMWVGFIPIIYVFITYITSYKKALKYGFIFGTTYYFIILHWIFNLYPLDWIDVSKEDSIIVLIAGWIFISVVEGCIIAVILAIFPLIKSKNNLLNVIAFGALWVMIEWVQGLGILGFTWGRIAVSQTVNLTLVQSASLFGSLFISFIIIFINGLLAIAIINSLKKSNWKKYIVFAVLIFIANMTYGFIKIAEKTDNEKIEVVVVQGNIPTAQKWQTGASKEHFKIYKDLTMGAIGRHNEEGKSSKIVFWPETAIPLSLSSSNWLLREYKNLVRENNIMLATGAFHTEKGEEEQDYNSIYFINELGEVENTYFKRHLVPFGEVMPYKDVIYKIFPILAEANLFNGDLRAGEETNVADSTYGRIGGIICFESIFPDLILDTVRDGAELIFVATNDSWFKDSKAVYQHNNNSILRAIETNRYVVRAANTGISSVINNKGEVIASLEPLVQGTINSEVEFISENTLYTKVGDLIVLLAFGFIVGMGALRIKS